jgi:NAD(P)-dependent dehydrogenase (short-subunit alcohol dehydrogenase family)
MRVLITGGTGAVGKATVERFVQQGWDVRVVGRRADMDTPGAEYQVCDITNYDDVRNQVRGFDAIVHLAAIPNPRVSPGPEVFRANALGTYNIFEAAAEEGIRKLVNCSSINAFGCFWGNTDITPRYLPIDEAHPTYTTDAYSFSKEVIEDIGDYYWRREGISSVALRLPAVYSQDRMRSPEAQAGRARTRALLDEFAAQPEAVRLARLEQARDTISRLRAQKIMEYPAAAQGWQREAFGEEPLAYAYNFDRLNFWAYVDERDSAQSIEKGITAAYTGSHALFINASTNWLHYDSRTLAKLFFPEVTEFKTPLTGAEALVNIGKARSLIGFEPEFEVEG